MPVKCLVNKRTNKQNMVRCTGAGYFKLTWNSLTVIVYPPHGGGNFASLAHCNIAAQRKLRTRADGTSSARRLKNLYLILYFFKKLYLDRILFSLTYPLPIIR